MEKIAPLDIDDDGWKLVPHYGKRGFKCQQRVISFTNWQKYAAEVDNSFKQAKQFQIYSKNPGKLNHIRHKYFPPKDCQYPAIAYDDDGLTYLTPHWIADEITDWIMNLYKNKMSKEPQVLIDGTAGLGGHVLSFGLRTQVPNIYAIELDRQRFGSLSFNVKTYDLENRVHCVNDDFVEWFKNQSDESLVNSCVFLDPPWGGDNYKDVDINELYLHENSEKKNSPIGMGDLCEIVLSKCKMIVLKLPENYNMNALKEKFVKEELIRNYQRKMLFVAILPKEK